MLKIKKKRKSVIALTKSKFTDQGNNIRNLYLDKNKLIKIANRKKKILFTKAQVFVFWTNQFYKI
jgi:hypothetical protein